MMNAMIFAMTIKLSGVRRIIQIYTQRETGRRRGTDARNIQGGGIRPLECEKGPVSVVGRKKLDLVSLLLGDVIEAGIGSPVVLRRTGRKAGVVS